MALFTVLEPPDKKPERVAFVPEKFAGGALVFGFLWALWHRMWVIAAGVRQPSVESAGGADARQRFRVFGLGVLVHGAGWLGRFGHA